MNQTCQYCSAKVNVKGRGMVYQCPKCGGYNRVMTPEMEYANEEARERTTYRTGRRTYYAIEAERK